MEEIAFAKIHDEHCAIVDITSIMHLSSYTDHFFTAITEPFLHEHLLNESKNPYFRAALATLERMIVYDFVVIDAVALSRNVTGGSLHLDIPSALPLRSTKPNKEVYTNILERMDLRPAITREINRLFDKENKDWYDGNYKAYFDELHKIDPSLVNVMANTGNSIERVLFYLEFSREARVPVMMSPDKDAFIERYEEQLVQEVFGFMQKHLTESFETAKGLFKAHEYWLPPLSEYMINYAFNKKTSVFNSYYEIKNAPSAREFKKWLREIQNDLLTGTRTNWVRANRNISEFRKAIARWVAEFDTKYGGHYTRLRGKAKFTLKILPSIFPVSASLEIEKPFKKNYILHKNMYLTFISDWLTPVDS